jgi:hypothetical protein
MPYFALGSTVSWPPAASPRLSPGHDNAPPAHDGTGQIIAEGVWTSMPNQANSPAAKGTFIKVYMTPEEKTRIVANAGACGMSLSAYLRTLAAGHVPTPRVDLSGLAEVFRIHADLGRLGGLLKMLLSNDERLNDMGRDMAGATIDGALVDIRFAMAGLKTAIEGFLGVRGGKGQS